MRIAPAPPSLDHLTLPSTAPPEGRGSLPFSVILREGAGGTSIAPPPIPATGHAMLGLLARAADSERAIDGFFRAAARGRTFTPGQLLAVQATVARYAQTVEVVSRGADRLMGAIKQTIGTQV
jgi:hypothetical protein